MGVMRAMLEAGQGQKVIQEEISASPSTPTGSVVDAIRGIFDGEQQKQRQPQRQAYSPDLSVAEMVVNIFSTPPEDGGRHPGHLQRLTEV